MGRILDMSYTALQSLYFCVFLTKEDHMRASFIGEIGQRSAPTLVHQLLLRQCLDGLNSRSAA